MVLRWAFSEAFCSMVEDGGQLPPNSGRYAGAGVEDHRRVHLFEGEFS